MSGLFLFVCVCLYVGRLKWTERLSKWTPDVTLCGVYVNGRV